MKYWPIGLLIMIFGFGLFISWCEFGQRRALERQADSGKLTEALGKDAAVLILRDAEKLYNQNLTLTRLAEADEFRKGRLDVFLIKWKLKEIWDRKEKREMEAYAKKARQQ